MTFHPSYLSYHVSVRASHHNRLKLVNSMGSTIWQHLSKPRIAFTWSQQLHFQATIQEKLLYSAHSTVQCTVHTRTFASYWNALKELGRQGYCTRREILKGHAHQETSTT